MSYKKPKVSYKTARKNAKLDKFIENKDLVEKMENKNGGKPNSSQP